MWGVKRPLVYSYAFVSASLTIKRLTMDLASIFRSFQELTDVTEKVTFLKQLATLNLPYDINYDALIAAWERNEN